MATKKKISVNIGAEETAKAGKKVANAVKAVAQSKNTNDFSVPLVGTVKQVGRDSHGKTVLYVSFGNGEVLRATIKGGEYSEYSATSQSLVGRSASLKPSSGGVEVVEFVEFI